VSNRVRFRITVLVARGRRAISARKGAVSQVGSGEPHSGAYEIEYREFVRNEDGTSADIVDTEIIHLEFTQNNEKKPIVYTISGTGKDRDGLSVIVGGQANLNGMAWWEEEITGTKKILRVLSTGTFNFQEHKFVGKWRSNNSVFGEYLVFKAKIPGKQPEQAPPLPETKPTPLKKAFWPFSATRMSKRFMLFPRRKSQDYTRIVVGRQSLHHPKKPSGHFSAIRMSKRVMLFARRKSRDYSQIMVGKQSQRHPTKPSGHFPATRLSKRFIKDRIRCEYYTAGIVQWQDVPIKREKSRLTLTALV